MRLFTSADAELGIYHVVGATMGSKHMTPGT